MGQDFGFVIPGDGAISNDKVEVCKEKAPPAPPVSPPLLPGSIF